MRRTHRPIVTYYIIMLLHIMLLYCYIYNRVFELRDELHKYVQETNKHDFAICLEDDHWLQRLSYFADIFHDIDRLNKSLQDTSNIILTYGHKILAFK